MEAFIDAARFEVTPEDFFLEFTRSFVAILQAHGAGPALAAMYDSAAETDAVDDAPAVSAARSHSYRCERLRDRVLGSALGPVLRPLADPLSEGEHDPETGECRGLAGWGRRLAVLAARPRTEPAAFCGYSAAELEQFARDPRPFAVVLGGVGYDWAQLFRGLTDAYGPQGYAHTHMADPAWSPAWLSPGLPAADGGGGKALLCDQLRAWTDKALVLLYVASAEASGEPLDAPVPPGSFVQRPAVVDGSVLLGGVLAQITPVHTGALDFADGPGSCVVALADLPQYAEK